MTVSQFLKRLAIIFTANLIIVVPNIMIDKFCSSETVMQFVNYVIAYLHLLVTAYFAVKNQELILNDNS